MINEKMEKRLPLLLFLPPQSLSLTNLNLSPRKIHLGNDICVLGMIREQIKREISQ